MRRIASVLALNRTRTQIFLSFLVVMAVVLSVSGGYLYRNVSALILSNAEAQVGETANQIAARLDAVLAEVDTLTLQLAMDPRVQDDLLKAYYQRPVTLDERLSLRSIIDNLTAFSWAIQSIELYAGYDPLYPLDLPPLHERVGEEAIRMADERHGTLVWRGLVPRNANQLLAIRQVPLEEEKLRGGGYVVAWVRPTILDFIRTEFSAPTGLLVRVYDENGAVVAESDASAFRTAGLNGAVAAAADLASLGDDGSYLKIERRSAVTGWSIAILVPKQALTGGLELFRRALVWSLLVGTAVSLLLMASVSGMITQPIRRLRRIMQQSLTALPRRNEESYFNFEINELNRAYNKLVSQLHHLVDSVYEKERLKNIAEIRMLQAQINPHFLFNTLDSLYWNLIARDERESASIVNAFSKLFRYSIHSSGGDDWVTLADEIEHVRLYMTVMKYRLRDRLTWRCRVDPECLKQRLPKLLIQPIVENAISHGIEPKLGKGHLSVTVRKASEENGPLLVIRVKDNGAGMEPERLEAVQARLDQTLSPAETPARGLGLWNVQQRLRLFYGDACRLAIDSAPGKGTTVTMKLPFGRHAS